MAATGGQLQEQLTCNEHRYLTLCTTQPPLLYREGESAGAKCNTAITCTFFKTSQ